MKHKVFGHKENVEYFHRKGAYIVPFSGDKVAVTKAPKGYYLIGGGLNEGESETDGIIRESLEETGYTVDIGEKICTGETYCWIESLKYYHPMQSYYLGNFVEKVKEPVEKDHFMMWLPVEEAITGMVIEMQAWAIKECYEVYKAENH